MKDSRNLWPLKITLAAALIALLALPARAQTPEDSNFHHSLRSASTNIIAASGQFPSMDAQDTSFCSAASTVTVNTGGGTSYTIRIQGSADNSTWYDVSGASGALASGTGSVSPLNITTGFRYVRIAWAWGAAPTTTGTGHATISCKR